MAAGFYRWQLVSTGVCSMPVERVLTASYVDASPYIHYPIRVCAISRAVLLGGRNAEVLLELLMLNSGMTFIYSGTIVPKV